MSGESAEVIALFRYRIIGEATSSRLSPTERGRIVRELTRRVYEHPDGSHRQYSRGTLDRWIRAYREQGRYTWFQAHAGEYVAAYAKKHGTKAYQQNYESEWPQT